MKTKMGMHLIPLIDGTQAAPERRHGGLSAFGLETCRCDEPQRGSPAPNARLRNISKPGDASRRHNGRNAVAPGLPHLCKGNQAHTWKTKTSWGFEFIRVHWRSFAVGLVDWERHRHCFIRDNLCYPWLKFFGLVLLNRRQQRGRRIHFYKWFSSFPSFPSVQGFGCF
jgi:hypothetical protein